jgi:hypothetical protein
MKTKTYYLVLAVGVGILCILVPAKWNRPALGQIELPLNHDKPFLIDQVNVALTGIEQLYVELSLDTRISHVDITTLQDIHQKVEHRLDKAGIKIISRPFLDSRPISSLTNAEPSRVAKLRIDIGTLRIENSQQYVFRIQTSLVREVFLSNDPTFSIKADVWKVEPVMQAVSVKHMPAQVTDVVLEQVEFFILAYKATNPQGKQPSDAGTSETDSLTATEKPAKPASESAVAEYRYVASKNSKVFHRPQCRWAKNISPGNLVDHTSRDEAIKTGRRPCKLCKP